MTQVPDSPPGGAPIGRGAIDTLFSAAYEELKRLASAVRRGDPSATITPTVLVNEAWLKLAKSPGFQSTSPVHFKRIVARAMRQVLVEAARRRNADKRGGDALVITLDESGIEHRSSGDQLIAIDTALEDFARVHPRQAAMVECRFFGGLDVSETATALGVSEATVLRDWRVAKAWLARELRAGEARA
jgi:RNA polymerase sigma factor (TIGR02999 family)